MSNTMVLQILAVCTLILASMQFPETEAGPVFAEGECTLSPYERTDCGFSGISQVDCIKKGCCFDSSIPEVIWCYKNPRVLVEEMQVQRAVDVQPVVQQAQTLQEEEVCV